MSTHEHWQKDASAPELYERYLVPAITSIWANDLLDRISPRDGESVLDIACGTGVVARLAAERGHPRRLVGIDLNAAMLAVARAKSATVELAGFAQIQASPAKRDPPRSLRRQSSAILSPS